MHRTQSAKTKKKKPKETREIFCLLSFASWVEMWVETETPEII
jgi:hypothetical protein